MNRPLLIALSTAAVIGITAGGVTALQVAEDEGRPASAGPTSRASSPATSPSVSPSTSPQASEPASGGPATTPSAAPGADDLLWATQRVLHDGDQEVRIDLRDVPRELHRVEDGWLVTTMSSPHEPAFEASLVRADGTVTHLADTFLGGDVSPDGTQYVAMRQDGEGYSVWDLTTGEETARLDEEPRPGYTPGGGAAFAGGGDTVLTRWTSPEGTQSIASVRVDDGATSLVGDGPVGEWAASPDGAQLAGSAADMQDPETGNAQCVELRPTAHPENPWTDCGHAFAGRPSFSPSGRRVLAASAPLEGFGPGLFRALRVQTGAPVGEIDAPDATLEARLLDDERAVVLAAGNLDGDGTVVYVCELDGPCEEAGRSTDAADTAVLGEVG